MLLLHFQQLTWKRCCCREQMRWLNPRSITAAPSFEPLPPSLRGETIRSLIPFPSTLSEWVSLLSSCFRTGARRPVRGGVASTLEVCPSQHPPMGEWDVGKCFPSAGIGPNSTFWPTASMTLCCTDYLYCTAGVWETESTCSKSKDTSSRAQQLTNVGQNDLCFMTKKDPPSTNTNAVTL